MNRLQPGSVIDMTNAKNQVHIMLADKMALITANGDHSLYVNNEGMLQVFDHRQPDDRAELVAVYAAGAWSGAWLITLPKGDYIFHKPTGE